MNGCIPEVARPAANVAVCSSAMPQSNERSGYLAKNSFRALPLIMAGVSATIESSLSASSVTVSAISADQDLKPAGVS